jgi:hypothetical protein
VSAWRHKGRSAKLQKSIDFESDRHRVDGNGKICGQVQTHSSIRIVHWPMSRKTAENFILLSPPLFCFASMQARLPMVLHIAR